MATYAAAPAAQLAWPRVQSLPRILIVHAPASLWRQLPSFHHDPLALRRPARMAEPAPPSPEKHCCAHMPCPHVKSAGYRGWGLDAVWLSKAPAAMNSQPHQRRRVAAQATTLLIYQTAV